MNLTLPTVLFPMASILMAALRLLFKLVPFRRLLHFIPILQPFLYKLFQSLVSLLFS